MPPAPLEYAGRELVARFLAAVVFEPGLSFRMIRSRANGQPALGVYTRQPSAAVFEPAGVLVFTLAGAKVSAITRFGASVLRWFDLPASSPGRPGSRRPAALATLRRNLESS